MKQEQINKKVKKIQKATNLLNLANHKALHDSVIVLPVEIEEEGITKRATKFEDRPDVGLVLSVGDEVDSMKVGDVVFFGQYSHFKVTHNKTSYLIMRAEDIYCVANEL